MEIIQRWAPWATGLLVAVAGWLSALLVWDVIGLATVERTSVSFAAPAPVQVEAAGSPAYDLKALVSVPLVGEANVANTATPVVSGEVKRSNLRINLLGVVAGGDQGVAILKHDGKEHAYKVGDQLNVSETITLAAVMPEYVIISRAGGNEKIELEQTRRSANSDIRVVQRSGGNTQNINLNDPSIRRPAGDPRQTLNNNPLRLTRYISAQPYVQGGKTVGFQVQAGRDKRLFGQLGLQGGDVVTTINGMRVGEAPVSDLLNSGNSGQTVEVEILRNGLPQTIRLNL